MFDAAIQAPLALVARLLKADALALYSGHDTEAQLMGTFGEPPAGFSMRTAKQWHFAQPYRLYIHSWQQYSLLVYCYQPHNISADLWPDIEHTLQLALQGLENTQQLSFLEDVLYHYPADVVILDAQYRYRYCNPSAIKNPQIRQWIIGKTNAEYAQYRGFDATFGQQRQMYLDQATQTKAAISWEETLQSPTGNRHFLRNILPVFENQQLKMMIGYGLDITELRETQKALDLADSQYHSLLENANIGIFRCNLDGSPLYINPYLANLHGFNQPQALLDTLQTQALHHYILPNKHAEFMLHLHQNGKVENYEAEVLHISSKNPIWVNQNAWLVKDHRGLPLYFEGTVQDISTRKQFNLQNQLILEATKLIDTGILISDCQNNKFFITPSFNAKIHFKSINEIFEFIKSKNPLLYNEIQLSLKQHGQWKGSIELINHLNLETLFDVQIQYILDYNQDMLGSVLLLSKPAYSDHSPTEYDHLLSDVALGIKSALSGIRGSLILLQSESLMASSQIKPENPKPDTVDADTTPLPPSEVTQQLQFELYHLINHHTQHIAQVLDDTLKLSSIKNTEKPFHFKSLEINAFLHQIFQHNLLKSQQMGIQVTANKLSSPFWVWADSSYLSQIFNSIITSSLNVLPAHAEIVLNALQLEHWFRIEIRIPHLSIADVFYQDYSEQSAQSSSISLLLYQAIAKRHGGHIGLSDSQPKGHIFYIDLPSYIYIQRLSMQSGV